jgi:hypothetical protein
MVETLEESRMTPTCPDQDLKGPKEPGEAAGHLHSQPLSSRRPSAPTQTRVWSLIYKL